MMFNSVPWAYAHYGCRGMARTIRAPTRFRAVSLRLGVPLPNGLPQPPQKKNWGVSPKRPQTNWRFAPNILSIT